MTAVFLAAPAGEFRRARRDLFCFIDFAGAWAKDRNGGYVFPTVPNDPLQREMAYRVGINIVMYTLTGNYKADQVHVPALLERLGQ